MDILIDNLNNFITNNENIRKNGFLVLKMNKHEKVLVLGASPNPDRYSYKAVKMLNRYGHEVVAVGNKDGVIDNTFIQSSTKNIVNIDTVTLYLSRENQIKYYNFIVDLKPKRVVFNPGTENSELIQLLENKGIETIQDCTLIMLSASIF
jgi:uncharacterized protein